MIASSGVTAASLRPLQSGSPTARKDSGLEAAPDARTQGILGRNVITEPPRLRGLGSWDDFGNLMFFKIFLTAWPDEEVTGLIMIDCDDWIFWPASMDFQDIRLS